MHGGGGRGYTTHYTYTYIGEFAQDLTQLDHQKQWKLENKWNYAINCLKKKVSIWNSKSNENNLQTQG
jgi:hypothetical protein